MGALLAGLDEAEGERGGGSQGSEFQVAGWNPGIVMALAVARHRISQSLWRLPRFWFGVGGFLCLTAFWLVSGYRSICWRMEGGWSGTPLTHSVREWRVTRGCFKWSRVLLRNGAIYRGHQTSPTALFEFEEQTGLDLWRPIRTQVIVPAGSGPPLITTTSTSTPLWPLPLAWAVFWTLLMIRRHRRESDYHRRTDFPAPNGETAGKKALQARGDPF